MATSLLNLKFHHVAVQTAHFERSLQFYTTVLGAELLSRRPFKQREMAWLRLGGVRIELFSTRAGQQLHSWSDFQPGPVHLALEVADLDSFLAHIRGLGVALHPSHPELFRPPVPGAGRMVYLLGPDGEEVEVREPESEHSD